MSVFPNLQPVMDELQYQSYANNREFNPEVSPERWGRVFGPVVKEWEARYQAERAIAKAKFEAEWGDQK